MKITIEKQELLSALQAVSKAINPKPLLPLYSCVLVEAEKDHVMLSATNFEIGIQVQATAKCNPFRTAVPAKLFHDVVSTFPDEELAIEFDKKTLSIKISSDNSENEIKCMNADDFPNIAIQATKHISIDAELFKNLIPRITFSAKQNDLTGESVLSGINIVSENGKVIFTGVDGFHASQEYVSLKKGEEKIKFEAIVNANTLDTVCKILPNSGDVNICQLNNQIGIFCGNTNITLQTLTGKFPDISQLLKQNAKTTVDIPTIPLSRACSQIQLFTNDKMSFNISGALVQMKAVDEQRGKSECQLVANKTGDDILIGVNVHFLKQLLNVCFTDEIVLEIENEQKPIICKMKDFKNFTHIIMPMVLK